MKRKSYPHENNSRYEVLTKRMEKKFEIEKQWRENDEERTHLNSIILINKEWKEKTHRIREELDVQFNIWFWGTKLSDEGTWKEKIWRKRKRIFESWIELLALSNELLRKPEKRWTIFRHIIRMCSVCAIPNRDFFFLYLVDKRFV